MQICHPIGNVGIFRILAFLIVVLVFLHLPFSYSLDIFTIVFNMGSDVKCHDISLLAYLFIAKKLSTDLFLSLGTPLIGHGN